MIIYKAYIMVIIYEYKHVTKNCVKFRELIVSKIFTVGTLFKHQLINTRDFFQRYNIQFWAPSKNKK